jgi:hypothetical protein
MKGNNLEGSGRGLILRNYPGIRLEGLRQITITCQDCRSLGRDLNPGPPKYEAGVLATRPRRSVNTTNSTLKKIMTFTIQQPM